MPKPAGLPPGLAKRDELPPGLEKQLEKNGTLPPGLSGPPHPPGQAPVAQDDQFSTDEDTALNGNLLADNGAGADSDPNSDALTVTQVNGQAASVGVPILVSTDGHDASLTVNADGSVSLDPQGNFDYLAPGEEATITFTYTISDGKFSDTATATVTVQGVNDVPVIGGVSTGDVTEDSDPATLTTFGLLTIADPDTGESNFTPTPQGGTAGSNGYGTFTLMADGNWSYEADNAQAAIQDLDPGETLTDSFEAVSSDGTANQTVTVTIHGVDLDLETLDGSNGFRLDGINAGDYSGQSVSAAGDINGDGIDDLIIGAVGASGYAGETYVVFGGQSFGPSFALADLDGSNGFRVDGIDAGDQSAWSASGAGDVNGDGIGDLIIGAPRANGYAGESYVVFGGQSLGASLALADLDGSNGFRIDGIDADDDSGASVAGAGDINGDGIDDLIIGAEDANGDAGESYVVFGGQSFGPSFDLASLDGSNGFRLDGIDPGDYSGGSIAGAGDINGDGVDDLIIGAIGANGYAGESYVVFGGQSFGPSFDLASLDGSNGFRLDGIDAGDESGISVSAAGDVNGDGVDDLIIGAVGANNDAGESYVVFGGQSFGPSLDLASLDGSNGFRLDGDGIGFSVSAAGDVNGDGVDDLIISSPGANSFAGESYVVFGGQSFGASLDLATLDGSNGFRLDGIDAGDASGAWVSAAGDINGDGFDDLIIGAPRADPGGNLSAGESYVVYGGDFTGAVAQFGTTGNDTLIGTGAAETLIGNLGDDTLQSNGGADVLRAGGGDDLVEISDAGFVKIDGGGGQDTLALSGAVDLDLTTISNSAIELIEAIDLNTTDANTLTLNPEDVFDLSETDNSEASTALGTATANTLVVRGSSGDTVSLAPLAPDHPNASGFWILASTGVVIGAETFDAYAFDDGTGQSLATVFIEHDIAVQGWSISLATLDGSNGFRIDGIDMFDQSGFSVSGAGDINGDGIDDLIIGARNADPGGNGQAGESYVVFGGQSFGASFDLASLDGSNGFRIDGIGVSGFSGWSVSDAGDVNGDGFGDLIIGAPRTDPGGDTDAGESYIVFGGQSFGASFDLTSLDGSNGFRIDGIDAGDQSARSVSGAGDINGDGFDDLLIGSPYANGNAGETYVVFGGPANLQDLDGNGDGVIDLADLDGSNGFRLDGAASDTSAYSVSGAGDVNGDGIADLIIGARRADPDGVSDAGASYVVFGGQSFGASLDLASLDGTNGFRLDGVDAGDWSGYSVSDAGDVNGDGFDDLIIGTLSGDNNSAGESYVVFGGQSFGASLDLASLDGTNGFRLDGIDPFDGAGRSVSGAGDLNGDGFEDLIVGAATADGFAGESYVVLGGPSFGASLDLTSLNGTNGFRLEGIDAGDPFGPNAGDWSGLSISGAGDLNGDGFDDLIIGAPYADPGGDLSAGESYVVYGGDFTGAVTQLGTTGNDTLTGTGATETLIGNLGDDTLQGNGGADVLRAGGGDDLVEISDAGFVKIDGGGGQDTLALSRAVDLDLTTISNSAIESIEAIDLNTTDANTLTLNPEDVFDLSETDNSEASTALGTATANTLVVRGSSGDTVSLAPLAPDHPNASGLWILASAGVAIGAETFDVYAFDDGNGQSLATVLIDHDISVEGWSISLATLDGSNGFRLNGINMFDQSGFSVSGAGDINGDGIDDLIIGARLADPGGNPAAGESYVVFGGQSFGASLDLASLDGSNGFRIDGVGVGGLSGFSVSDAGDVNGDGIGDLIIGAPRIDLGGDIDAGESYIVFGGQSFGASFDLTSLDGSNGFRIDGIDAGDQSARSVSGAGDINGDGFDDLLIGSPYANGNAGETYVVFGGPANLQDLDGNGDGVIDLADLDGSNGFRLDGAASDTSAYSVSGAGDVNGDGIADLIIGARRADPDGVSDAGASYVVFGGQSFGASLDLASLDGTNGFRLDGVDAGDWSGYSVSDAGDINGDGFDDLIIGTPFGDNSGAGESYVVFGGQSFGASLDLASLDGSNGFRLDGVDAFDQSGRSVSSAGDINGDGFDDLIIGAADANSDAGESYVVFGGQSFGANLDLASLDGTNGFRLEGIDAGDRSGSSVSSAGDVNGDGFDDLVIGAYPGGDSLAGESYVVFGGDFAGAVTQLGTTGNDTLIGTGAAETLIGDLGDDTLQGNGGADVLRAGGGDDLVEISDAGFVKIDGGGGQDTLALSGAVDLDLTTISNSAIESIEAIDLNTTDANTLTLNPEDVFDLSETDNSEASTALGTATANTLVVRGSSGDTVSLAPSRQTTRTLPGSGSSPQPGW